MMKRRLKKSRRILQLLIFFLLCSGCGTPSDPPSIGRASEREPQGERPAATASNQCRIRYAKGFDVSYHDGCKIVTVFEPGQAPGSKGTATFVLVPRGTRRSLPAEPARGAVIEIPVRRVVLRSASHAPFFSMLGLADRIVGITQGKYVNDPKVSDLIRRGLIAEVGVGSGMTSQFDMERLFSLRPDLVLSWWTNNPAYAAHIKAQEAGLPIALLSDYEESSPLGRAEWVKFVAAFFDAEAAAERVFDDVERRYLAMAAKTRGVHLQPTVLYGSSYQGSWYIAGGKSYFANLVRDAGGLYVWADDNSTGSRPVNVETAMFRGRNADYWFTQNHNHFSLASVAAEDSRYKLFRSFQAERVYSNNGKIGPGGGNDYYQATVARPDLLLADMIAILHPELLPGHKLIWHLHLPPNMPDGTDGFRARGK